MTGRPVLGPIRGGGRRTVEHPLTGRQVRDIASGQTGELMEATEEWHDGRILRLAHIRPPGGGVEWFTALDNIHPAAGNQ